MRMSALGDVLMFVPLVRALQSHFPHARITWVISRPAYDLVENMDGVEFIIIQKPRSLKDYWQFRKIFRERRYDVLIAAQASLRANLLYPLIRAKRKIGYGGSRAKDGHAWFVHETINCGRCHTLESFLKLAEPLGLLKPEITWRMPLSEIDFAWADEQLKSIKKPILIINPAASRPERTWAVERYIEVIEFAQSSLNFTVILTGGPGAVDKMMGEAIVQSLPSVINLIGQTKPKQLMALIQRAALLLSPDTGPAHMAAAVGTPVIALHAATNVDISAPYSYQDLAINVYPEALKTHYGKTVDQCRWGTQVRDARVMDLITTEVVKKQLSTFSE